MNFEVNFGELRIRFALVMQLYVFSRFYNATVARNNVYFKRQTLSSIRINKKVKVYLELPASLSIEQQWGLLIGGGSWSAAEVSC